MKITLDKKTIEDFEKRKIKKIKIFFFGGGCSGTKLDISEDFLVDETLTQIDGGNYLFDIYLERKDSAKFDNAFITRLEKIDTKNPHLDTKKISYIFSNSEVKDRCGCGTSFSFEKKVPKLNLENLKKLKGKF